MTENKSLRTIRSFVRREGRLTASQQRALEQLWPLFSLPQDDTMLDLNTIFERDAPKVLEIGFGNGTTLAEMAKNQTDHDFIGVEVHRPGVGQLLRLIEQYALTNLRVECGDAVELLKTRIADNSLDKVQIFFPDPWHKKRHNKRRIIQPAFVELLAKKLKPGGQLHLATDWQDYAEHMLDVLNNTPLFINASKDKSYIARPAYRPLTKFEQRGHQLGHGVWDLLFICQ